MARAVQVLVDPSVRLVDVSRALAAAGLMLRSDNRGSLRVLYAPSGGATCEEDGCTRPMAVRDASSGALLCPAHALQRLQSVEVPRVCA